MRKSKSTHGGKRKGAGRPWSPEARCACGKFTAATAMKIRHRCEAKHRMLQS
jgi:hypothetical protein